VHGSTEPWAEFCYNTYYHSALRTTPFQVVYGRSPPPLIPRTAKTPSTATVDGLKQERDAFLNDVHERLLQAQQYAKKHYDDNHCHMEFNIGDWVWL